jgi:hypothetical protein
MSDGATTWDRTRDSLGDYSPKELTVRLAALLTPRVPKGARRLPQPARQALLQDALKVIEDHAGAWYKEAGVELGNESFTPYCTCHSFFNGPARCDVAANIGAILGALQCAHGWLRLLDRLFRSLDLPPDEGPRLVALARAVREVIDLTAQATDCNEAWYNYARQAVGWLLQSQGLTPSAELEQAIAATWAAFTSWSRPAPEQEQAAADAVALAAVREELHRRYGAG